MSLVCSGSHIRYCCVNSASEPSHFLLVRCLVLRMQSTYTFGTDESPMLNPTLSNTSSECFMQGLRGQTLPMFPRNSDVQSTTRSRVETHVSGLFFCVFSDSVPSLKIMPALVTLLPSASMHPKSDERSALSVPAAVLKSTST